MKLVSILANPVPEDAVAGTLKTADGRALRFARFGPPRARRGTVCVLQGRTEFVEKYFETVRDLRNRGFAVATLDWRGQGLSDRILSDPRKGHVGDFGEYETDLETFMREVVLPDCPPPLFALAHCMGAAVVLRALHQGRSWFERVVLCAPMIGLYEVRTPATRFAVGVLRRMGLGRAYIPGGTGVFAHTLPFMGNPATSDPVRYARNREVLEAEPALGIGSPTLAWANAAFRTMGEFAEPGYALSIRQPILIVAAGADTVVSTQAIEEFGLRLRAGSHLILPGARHEILMEQDRFRAEFWAAFDAFVPGTRPFA